MAEIPRALLQSARVAWADYFERQGVSYVFWSAKLAALAADDETGAASRSRLHYTICLLIAAAALLQVV